MELGPETLPHNTIVQQLQFPLDPLEGARPKPLSDLFRDSWNVQFLVTHNFGPSGYDGHVQNPIAENEAAMQALRGQYYTHISSLGYCPRPLTLPQGNILWDSYICINTLIIRAVLTHLCFWELSSSCPK